MWIFVTIVLLLAASFFLRSAYEKRTLSVTEYETAFSNLPEDFDGYRVAFLSDLHSDRFGERNEKLVASVRDLRPDLVLLGGDMVTVKKPGKADFGPLEELLKGLSGIKVISGLGNHEARLFEDGRYGAEKEEYLRILTENGVLLLDNASVDLKKGASGLRVSGLSMTREQGKKGRKAPFSQEYIEENLGKPEGFRILLYHSPLYVREIADWGADLALYGHFHGGTVRLPILGGVMSPQFQFFYRYSRGLFRFGEKAAVVSGGLGTHSVPVRFCNKPETILIALRRKDGQ